MTAQHVNLAAGGWSKLSLTEQMGNIGSEVGRAIKAHESGNDTRKQAALDRALDLFDLTLKDERWSSRRKELALAREVVCDYLVGDNQYGSSATDLEAYFMHFATAARRGK